MLSVQPFILNLSKFLADVFTNPFCEYGPCWYGYLSDFKITFAMGEYHVLAGILICLLPQR